MKTWKPLDYPEGSMLFDVRYYRNPEYLEVVYLDPVTQQLEVRYEEPIVDIWFVKEEDRNFKYQIAQIEMDKCYPVYCKPSQISSAIAKNIGGEWAETYQHMKDNNMSSYDIKKKMCECPYVFKADFVPDVYFRLKWIQQYGIDSIDITKVTYGLLDIEVDVVDQSLDMKDYKHAPQPINAVTVIFPHVKIAACLVLGPRSKSQIHEKFHKLLDKQKGEYEWLCNNKDAFKRMIVEDDKDNKEYLEGYDIRIHTFDFDDEINLIKTVFDYINKYRPMFVLSWNAQFDHNYLPARCEHLGYDPIDFVIPKEFKTKQWYYKPDMDTKNFSMKNSKDWLFTSTYSVYMCQMKQFAKVRKGESERRSYSLSSVGKDFAKIDKLTDSKSGLFRTFAYTDFIKFILYNIRDVVVQLAVEISCCDCQSLMSNSFVFSTQFSKCYQETHIVRNTREYYYEEQGFIQACAQIIDPTIDPAFRGAFVADPKHNAPTGFILNGKRVNNILFGVLDADAKAYYPSSKMFSNLDPMALLYKADIDNSVFTTGVCRNKSFSQQYVWYDTKNRPHKEDLTGPILNSYKNKNIFGVLYNWFNIASMSEYFSYIDSRL